MGNSPTTWDALSGSRPSFTTGGAMRRATTEPKTVKVGTRLPFKEVSPHMFFKIIDETREDCGGVFQKGDKMLKSLSPDQLVEIVKGE